MPDYSFDSRLRGSGYRNLATGKFVSRSTVLDWVNTSLRQSENVTDTLASLVGGESPVLSAADWRLAMRQEIKDETIRQYLGGIGGRDQMTSQRWGQVGGIISDQFKFLDGFAEEVASGELSEAQIRARSKMYINSTREAYNRAEKRVKVAAGATEERWNLTNAENCEDCIEFDSFGWVDIEDDVFDGCEPGSGCTVCVTNCRCFKSYR